MSHTHIVAIRLGWERKSVSHRYQFPGNLGRKKRGRESSRPAPARPSPSPDHRTASHRLLCSATRLHVAANKARPPPRKWLYGSAFRTCWKGRTWPERRSASAPARSIPRREAEGPRPSSPALRTLRSAAATRSALLEASEMSGCSVLVMIVRKT